jgi:hypothetical protein
MCGSGPSPSRDPARRGEELMPGASRERVTIDLRGLGPALRAHANARNLAVAAVARQAIVAALESSPPVAEEEPAVEPGPTANATIKLTVRLRSRVAIRLATRARACGLSYGGYLATLIDGTSAPLLAADHQDAIVALAASTDRMECSRSGSTSIGCRSTHHAIPCPARAYSRDRTIRRPVAVIMARRHAGKLRRSSAAPRAGAAPPAEAHFRAHASRLPPPSPV